jgi:Domain of unknown function (DUF397)
MSRTDFTRPPWRKSSYSNAQANCVEVATAGRRGAVVTVRDSKSPGGTALMFTADAWRQFVQTARTRT